MCVCLRQSFTSSQSHSQWRVAAPLFVSTSPSFTHSLSVDHSVLKVNHSLTDSVNGSCHSISVTVSVSPGVRCSLITRFNQLAWKLIDLIVDFWLSQWLSREWPYQYHSVSSKVTSNSTMEQKLLARNEEWLSQSMKYSARVLTK